jgi:hypothetical protein
MRPQATKARHFDLRSNAQQRHAAAKFESPLAQTFCTLHDGNEHEVRNSASCTLGVVSITSSIADGPAVP